MAPEARTDPVSGFGPASDTYAFGMLMYEVLIGRAPWSDIDDPAAIFRHASTGVRPPLPLDHLLDGELSQLIRECWRPEPERRPSMRVVRERLDAWVARRANAAAFSGPIGHDIVEKIACYVKEAGETAD